jgi:hypothetical protein
MLITEAYTSKFFGYDVNITSKRQNKCIFEAAR